MSKIWGSYHKEELAYQVQLWAEGSWVHNLSGQAGSERTGHELIVVLLYLSWTDYPIAC